MKGKDKMPTRNNKQKLACHIHGGNSNGFRDFTPSQKKEKRKKEKRSKELILQTSIVYLLQPEISYSSVPWSSIVDHSSLF